MKFKKVIMGLACVAGLVVLGACGSSGNKEKSASDDSWKKVQDAGKVTIGLDDTFVPMGFRDDKGNIVGFDVDLAKAVFDQYNIKVKFQPIDWSMKETELNNGTIDFIWNGYSITDARKKKVLFTDTYMKNDQVLVTPKSEKITSFKGMKDKVLGAQNGSSGYDVFTKQPEVLMDIVKDNDAVLYDSFNEAFIDLKSGRINGLLIDKVYANYYLTQSGELDNYDITTGDYDTEDYAAGARKDDKKLVEKVNEGLKELHDNGKFKEISDKWFGEDVTPK